jgi:hypothetical protein
MEGTKIMSFIKRLFQKKNNKSATETIKCSIEDGITNTPRDEYADCLDNLAYKLMDNRPQIYVGGEWKNIKFAYQKLNGALHKYQPIFLPELKKWGYLYLGEAEERSLLYPAEIGGKDGKVYRKERNECDGQKGKQCERLSENE